MCPVAQPFFFSSCVRSSAMSVHFFVVVEQSLMKKVIVIIRGLDFFYPSINRSIDMQKEIEESDYVSSLNNDKYDTIYLTKKRNSLVEETTTKAHGLLFSECLI
jgi:hypothetical protein